MQKTLTGIVVTTFVLFIWGFIYWGVSPMPYSAWHQTEDDAAAQEMLAEHFPESGTYFVPGRDHEDAALQQLYDKGPVGFVHIRHGSGDMADPTIMVAGFILNLVVVALLAALFKVAGAREFRDFARISVVAGAVAVVAIDVGDMIWWQIPVDWKIWQLIYDYTLWLIAGHLLGIFMKQPSETAEVG